jgi:gamma-glutamyltranspeptidase/glutathione hydrolase
MDDFTARPGEPNAFGLLQSDRNAPGPGKRPLSSMSPTMVLKNDKPVLLLGGSGGPRIITALLNVLLNHLDGEQPLPDALSAPRIHHQWQPNEVFFDRPPDEAVSARLRTLGHAISDRKKGAAVQAIGIRDGELVGVSDPRKGGRPAGE